MMRSILKKGGFLRNALTLVTGATIAQAIPLASTPILTRMFTPEDFGLLALYIALISILSVIATGRYEVAIMLPKSDKDAQALLKASISISCAISLLILVPIILWKMELARFLGNEKIENWLYLVPVSIFFSSVYQCVTYWSNRKGDFKPIAYSRVNQSFIQSTAQIGLGAWHVNGGLIIGQVIGIISSLFSYVINKNVRDALFYRSSRARKLINLRNYNKFPKYGMPGALSNALASDMIIVLLTKYYSAAITGMFSLTYRVLNVPAGIISSSASQVFFNKVVEVHRNHPAKLKSFVLKSALALFALYLPMIPLFFFLGEPIFIFAFGQEWKEAGSYAAYLVLAVAVRFSVSPLSVVLGLEHNVKMGASWQILYLATITLTLTAFSMRPVEDFIIAFVVHEIALYGIYLLLILRGTKRVV